MRSQAVPSSPSPAAASYTPALQLAAAKQIAAHKTSARVKAAPAQYPCRNRAARAPGYIQAENFDTAGEGVAYHDTTAGNKYALYRPSADVDIMPTGDGGFCVAATQAGEWLEYQFYAMAPGRYDLTERVASVGTGGTFRVNVDGRRQTAPLTVSNTRSWQNWVTITQPGIYLSGGWHTRRLVMDYDNRRGFVGAFDWLRFTSSIPAAPTTAAPFNDSTATSLASGKPSPGFCGGGWG